MIHRATRRLVLAVAGALLAAGSAHAAPIVGDQTLANLTVRQLLEAAGISLTVIGTAELGTDLAGREVILFPITGGDFAPPAGTIEHDGSGFLLSRAPIQFEIENLLLDLTTSQVFADVTVNGTPGGTVPLFDVADCFDLIGTPGQCLDGDQSVLLSGLKLSATQTAAAALTAFFGLPDLTGQQVAVAEVDVRVPEPGAALLLGLGVALAAIRAARRP